MYSLGLAWRSAYGRPCHWEGDWSGTLVFQAEFQAGLDWYSISGWDSVFQCPTAPMKEAPKSGAGLPHDDGYFYFTIDNSGHATYGVKYYTHWACPEGMPHTYSAGEALPQPQCVTLTPVQVSGDFAPAGYISPDVTYDITDEAWDSGRFMTGFLVEDEPDAGWHESNVPFPPPRAKASLLIASPLYWHNTFASGETYSLKHYEPWAWSGKPIDVMSSIVHRLFLGGFLDHFSFDVASRAYTIDPWLGISDELTIHCSRVIGVSVARMLSSIIQHTRDCLFFSMSGKLSVASNQWPMRMPSLTNDDGVIDYEYGHTTDYMMNNVEANYGSGYVVTGLPGWQSHLAATPPAARPAVSRIESTNEVSTNKWRVADSVAASIALYGDRKNSESAHPYMLGADGDLPHLTRWLAEDASASIFVDVKQDMRGCGYDNGWEVTSVDVSSEIPSARRRMTCVRKEIDFDTLTVRSMLVERKRIATDAFESSWAGGGDYL